MNGYYIIFHKYDYISGSGFGIGRFTQSYYSCGLSHQQQVEGLYTIIIARICWGVNLTLDIPKWSRYYGATRWNIHIRKLHCSISKIKYLFVLLYFHNIIHTYLSNIHVAKEEVNNISSTQYQCFVSIHFKLYIIKVKELKYQDHNKLNLMMINDLNLHIVLT